MKKVNTEWSMAGAEWKMSAKEAHDRKVRDTVGAIFGAIVMVVCIAFLVNMYTKVSHRACPYCGAPIEYSEKVYKHGKTMYRYYCSENHLHQVDLPIRMD